MRSGAGLSTLSALTYYVFVENVRTSQRLRVHILDSADGGSTVGHEFDLLAPLMRRAMQYSLPPCPCRGPGHSFRKST